MLSIVVIIKFQAEPGPQLVVVLHDFEQLTVAAVQDMFYICRCVSTNFEPQLNHEQASAILANMSLACLLYSCLSYHHHLSLLTYIQTSLAPH